MADKKPGCFGMLGGCVVLIGLLIGACMLSGYFVFDVAAPKFQETLKNMPSPEPTPIPRTVDEEVKAQLENARLAAIERHKDVMDESQSALDKGNLAPLDVNLYRARVQSSKSNITLLGIQKDKYRPQITSISIGSVGILTDPIHIVQVIDASSFLGEIENHGEQVAVFTGTNTSNMTDGRYVTLKSQVIWVKGTTSYTNVLGARRTVLLILVGE